MTKKQIKELEKEYDVKIVYITEFGSKLYGTNSESSDTDYKGIFIPKVKDLILKRDIENIKRTTGSKDKRNTKDDIDIELWSIHKFFKLLSKGETGSIDLLFSMWSKSIIYENKAITSLIRRNYKIFLTKSFKAFVGYCINQASKYGIKGSRYGELLELKKELDVFFNHITEDDLEEITLRNFYWSPYCKHQRHYIKFLIKNEKDYLSVLGKLHDLDISLNEFEQRLDKQLESYGDRSKLASKGVDWKAFSHAYRVLFEMGELIDTEFISFPLKYSKSIKEVKYNSNVDDLDDILNEIADKLAEVDKKLESSALPNKVNGKAIDELVLNIYKEIR